MIKAEQIASVTKMMCEPAWCQLRCAQVTHDSGHLQFGCRVAVELVEGLILLGQVNVGGEMALCQIAVQLAQELCNTISTRQ